MWDLDIILISERWFWRAWNELNKQMWPSPFKLLYCLQFLYILHQVLWDAGAIFLDQMSDCKLLKIHLIPFILLFLQFRREVGVTCGPTLQHIHSTPSCVESDINTMFLDHSVELSRDRLGITMIKWVAGKLRIAGLIPDTGSYFYLLRKVHTVSVARTQ
jgi:hypothetical protein